MNTITTWEQNRTSINSGMLEDDELVSALNEQAEIAIEACTSEADPSHMLQIADDILCDYELGFAPDNMLGVANQLVHVARQRL